MLFLEPVDHIVNLEAVHFHQSVKIWLNVGVPSDLFNSADVFSHITTPPGNFVKLLILKAIFSLPHAPQPSSSIVYYLNSGQGQYPDKLTFCKNSAISQVHSILLIS